MKKAYTLLLGPDEAATIRSLLKDQAMDEAVFISIHNTLQTPGAKPMIEYAEKKRDIYLKTYEMLWRPDEQRGHDAEL